MDCFVMIPLDEGLWATACFKDEFKYPGDWMWTADRILPGSFGGTYDPENVHLSHFGCQNRQGNAIEAFLGVALYGMSEEEKFAARSKGGQKGGRSTSPAKVAACRQTARIRKVHPDAGRWAVHFRWHVNRGIKKEGCPYCV